VSGSEHDGHTPDRHEDVESVADHVADPSVPSEPVADPDQRDAREARMPRTEPDDALTSTPDDGLSTGAARWIAVVGSVVSILIIVALVIAAAA
jgi:hypothetical protein